MKRALLAITCVSVLLGCSPANATPQKGDNAPMFKSVDENLKPVDMRNLTRDRPLVLIVGSAS